MSEIEEIIDHFEYIRQKQRPVSIVSTFQGVSLSLEVGVQQVIKSRGNVAVGTKHGRPISLLPATTIQIHNDLFPKPIQAKVVSVDVIQRTAILGQLSYFQSDHDARKETRVQPKFTVKTRISVGGQENKSGMINNISGEGISIVFPSSEADFMQVCLPNTSVRIEYSLPVADQNESVDISTPAKVTYSNINPMGKFIVGFQTFPKEGQRDILRRFIFDCQTEMFNDLEKESSAPPGSSIIF